MNSGINIIITGEGLGKRLDKKLSKLKVSHLIMPKCIGFPVNFSVLDFIGVTEPKKYLLAFVCEEEKSKVLLAYILKYHNKKNNGIMFKILEEDMETESKLFIAIVNAGKAEKVADIIRKECQSGATICDARGSGANSKTFLGIQIDSNKEVVFSVMEKSQTAKMKKLIKENFQDDNTDVVSFILPVSDFNKLHQE